MKLIELPGFDGTPISLNPDHLICFVARGKEIGTCNAMCVHGVMLAVRLSVEAAARKVNGEPEPVAAANAATVKEPA